MNPFLDFIIRNQLAILFFFSATVLVLVYLKLSSYETKIEEVRRPGLRGIVALPIAMALGFSFAEFKIDIIDRTYQLTFPPMFCAKTENTKLLVFIHGWRGDSEETWRKFPNLVCDDPDLDDVNVLVIDYPTYITRRDIHIAPLSKWINDELNVTEDWKRYNKIAIIAHSMGGLIARKITILNALKNDQQMSGPLIEIATPHMGLTRKYSFYAKVLGIGKKLVKEEMKKNSSFLTTLKVEWEQLEGRPITYCFTSIGDSVVSQESATSQCDHFTIFPFDWDHRDIVKPKGEKDSRYTQPIHHIVNYMK